MSDRCLLKIRSFLIFLVKEFISEKIEIEMLLFLCLEEVEFLNNRFLVFKRFFFLKERFKRDLGYYKDYVKFMEGVLKDCVERCEGDVVSKMGRVNYVLYYGIYYFKKSGKIYVVFDCSVRYVGIFLN